MAFVIDTRGNNSCNKDNAHLITEDSDENDDDFAFIPMKPEQRRRRNLDSKDEFYELDETYPSLRTESLSKRKLNQKMKKREFLKKATKQCQSSDSVLTKSATLQPGLEKLESVPSYAESKRRRFLQRKAEQERTKGSKWFNLPAPEVSEDMKNDIEALQMRSALNPKHFYKKNDMKHTPKYFQIGRVVESPADFYSSRVPKKQRKRTFVDDLLADADFRKQTKRRYKEIISERQKTSLQYVREKRRQQKKKGLKSNKSSKSNKSNKSNS